MIQTKLLIFLFFISMMVSQDKQLYTCGMHPNVIQESKGICPICEMTLTPIKKQTEVTKTKKTIVYWRAPMNPQEIYDKPGKSNMGMDLVPVYSNEIEGTTVRISPALQQNMGVRTTEAYFKPLIKDIKTTGSIQFDETKVAHVSLKISGWVEKLNVNFIGQNVKKGQSLIEIYSPELVNAQQEYLTALNAVKILGTSGADLVTSARRRLKYWDISDRTIEELEISGKALRTVKIYSPFSGIVTKKTVKHGHHVKRGTALLELADLSKVWLMLDIYEKDLPFIKIGQKVFVTLPYDPTTQFVGVLDFIFPVLDKQTRSVKARVILHNPKKKLKINMLAEAKISAVLDGDVVVAPSEAIIQTGARSIVILDNGDNTFTPREVKLGHYFDNVYQITAGLNSGDRIVTSAQFLIDSESKLKEAIQKILSGRTSSPTEDKKMDMNHSMTKIDLPSIQCTMCVETITAALQKVDGISKIHIDLENKRAGINFDPAKLSKEKIELAIANSGYHANMKKRVKWAYNELPECCRED